MIFIEMSLPPLHKDTGPAVGQRLRDMILSKGHTEDYGPMFKAFYGKDPDVGAMPEEHGLAPDAK